MTKPEYDIDVLQLLKEAKMLYSKTNNDRDIDFAIKDVEMFLSSGALNDYREMSLNSLERMSKNSDTKRAIYHALSVIVALHGFESHPSNAAYASIVNLHYSEYLNIVDKNRTPITKEDKQDSLVYNLLNKTDEDDICLKDHFKPSKNKYNLKDLSTMDSKCNTKNIKYKTTSEKDLLVYCLQPGYYFSPRGFNLQAPDLPDWIDTPTPKEVPTNPIWEEYISLDEKASDYQEKVHELRRRMFGKETREIIQPELF